MNRNSMIGGVVLAAMCLLSISTSTAQEGKSWMRYPAISPDGKTIAFSFRGDIWTVPSDGGNARMLTSHQGYERSPVWSPDSKSIAFMVDWHGNSDVYTISVAGGSPTRLTFHSAGDEPTAFSPDGKHVIFTSRRLDAPQSRIGSSGMGELYSIPIAGGRPKQIMTTTAEYANYSPDGKKLVFHDYKGFEDTWRKHHTSSVTRDIWTYDIESGSYTKLSGFKGEDRNPVWSADGNSIYYLSEQLQPSPPRTAVAGAVPKETRVSLINKPFKRQKSGRVIPQLQSSFNIWKLDAKNPDKQTRVTKHSIHPVRFLSVAEDGTLCYGFNGEIWTKKSDQDPTRVPIQVTSDVRSNASNLKVLRDGATGFAVSPNEEEIAFVVRGEVFVANVEFGTTKRITNTPEQERTVTWGSDNRTLYYAGERNNSWNLYEAKVTREDEEGFANATIITEQPLLETKDETFQPSCSPDGKKLVYLKNRTEIILLDLETKKSSSLVPAKLNFSYSDGDISYDWSGDSRFVVMTYHGRESWISEIGVVNISTGEITNMTNSGYAEGGPIFASNGTAILYASDRYGERSHGSWGGENDVMGIYLTQKDFDKATLSKKELALKEKREKKDKKKPAKEDETKKPDSEKTASSEKKKDEKVKPIKLEKEDLELRRRRLTLHSSQLASFDLSPDGEHLLYISQVDDKWGLWLCRIRDRNTSNIMPLGGSPSGGRRRGGGGGTVQFSKDGKSAFLMQGGKLSKVSLAGALGGSRGGSGKASAKPIPFAAEMNVNGPGEREYIFEHAWRQVQDKFYDPNLHGVDWNAMKQNYAAFLPSINNDYDFAEMLSEMLGELNASHTGCRYRPRRTDGDSTAGFGLLYDVKYDGVGLKVATVIKRGPCDTADCKIEPGVVITHINGERLTDKVNPWKLLNRQSGKPVRLTLAKGESGDEWEEIIRPISSGAETNLLYERWIASRRALCEKLSDGKIGYVHVRGMNDASFRRVYEEVLGINNEKKALIVDTRFNGGGWLHEDLATFLSGKTYCQFAPRGHEGGGLGGEPINKWTKPVVVVQSESNYSDAHFFPWAFKEKGVGKLIGSPVPGTATAVWWESQINSSIVFGIPQVGMITRNGEYLENNQLEPDVLVINDPQSMAKGEDKQLAKAVQVLLKDLEDGKEMVQK